MTDWGDARSESNLSFPRNNVFASTTTTVLKLIAWSNDHKAKLLNKPPKVKSSDSIKTR